LQDGKTTNLEERTKWDTEDQNSVTYAEPQTHKTQRNVKYVVVKYLIIDATAGNRTMWTKKDSEDILYTDMERRLEIPPNLFCDSRHMPFRDNVIDTIFWDPPHMWGVYNRTFAMPNKKLQRKILPNKKSMDPYYGVDKYSNKQGLISYMFYAQKEFRRILKPDGLLWLKWNECSISLRSILVTLSAFTELMRIRQHAHKNPMGTHKTFWVVMIQKKEKVMQSTLI